MSVEKAVIAASPGSASLHGFHDEFIAKMELRDEGKWILLARVTLNNADSDSQWVVGKLVHDANVVIAEEKQYIGFLDPFCTYFQVGFISKGKETITLQCNTYNGAAEHGSILALKVDDIEFQ